MSKLIITCVEKNENKVIKEVGVIDDGNLLSDSHGGSHWGRRTKKDFIEKVREYESKSGKKADIETSIGVKVSIIKENGLDKYLRTDGDDSQMNDLVDLGNCPRVFM